MEPLDPRAPHRRVPEGHAQDGGEADEPRAELEDVEVDPEVDLAPLRGRRHQRDWLDGAGGPTGLGPGMHQITVKRISGSV